MLPDARDRPLLSVDEARSCLGNPVSRSSWYRAVAAGEIPSISVGRRRLIPTAALARLLEGEATNGSGAVARARDEDTND
jgi:excisionase family DNA binding protein